MQRIPRGYDKGSRVNQQRGAQPQPKKPESAPQPGFNFIPHIKYDDPCMMAMSLLLVTTALISAAAAQQPRPDETKLKAMDDHHHSHDDSAHNQTRGISVVIPHHKFTTHARQSSPGEMAAATSSKSSDAPAPMGKNARKKAQRKVEEMAIKLIAPPASQQLLRPEGCKPITLSQHIQTTNAASSTALMDALQIFASKHGDLARITLYAFLKNGGHFHIHADSAHNHTTYSATTKTIHIYGRIQDSTELREQLMHASLDLSLSQACEESFSDRYRQEDCLQGNHAPYVGAAPQAELKPNRKRPPSAQTQQVSRYGERITATLQQHEPRYYLFGDSRYGFSSYRPGYTAHGIDIPRDTVLKEDLERLTQHHMAKYHNDLLNPDPSLSPSKKALNEGKRREVQAAVEADLLTALMDEDKFTAGDGKRTNFFKRLDLFQRKVNVIIANLESWLSMETNHLHTATKEVLENAALFQNDGQAHFVKLDAPWHIPTSRKLDNDNAMAVLRQLHSISDIMAHTPDGDITANVTALIAHIPEFLFKIIDDDFHFFLYNKLRPQVFGETYINCKLKLENIFDFSSPDNDLQSKKPMHQTTLR